MKLVYIRSLNVLVIMENVEKLLLNKEPLELITNKIIFF